MKPGVAALVLVMLSACAPESDGITLVRSIGPGPEKPNAATIVSLFQNVCIESRGEHDKMLAALGRLPVDRDPRSDIYYHRDFDTSYKAVLQDGAEACSFVTGVTAGGGRIVGSLEQQGKAARLRVEARSERTASGRSYVVARVISE